MMKEKIQNLTCAISSFEEVIKTNVTKITEAKTDVKQLTKAKTLLGTVGTIVLVETVVSIDTCISRVEAIIKSCETEISNTKDLIKESKSKISKLEKMQKEYESLQLETTEHTEDIKEEITNA